MSSGELILTLLVALLVFGPQKLPMLARHLAWLVKQLQAWQQQATALWQQVQLQQQLEANLEKARSADQQYANQPTEAEKALSTQPEKTNESL